MHTRAAQLISLLDLTPHPEGGYFREIYRADSTVEPPDARGTRASLTTIYFLLTAGDISRWHRVTSDEAWHYYEGDALELLNASPGFERVDRLELGPVNESSKPVHVIPAHHWQAARTQGHYTLVGCTVGPGFDFKDFTMLSDAPADRERLMQRRPDLGKFV